MSCRIRAESARIESIDDTTTASHAIARRSVVGVIGVGVMGRAYSDSLCPRGHRVVVYDIDPARAHACEASGGQVADTLAAMLRARPDTLLLSLPSDDVFTAVIDELCALPMGSQPARPVVVDTSTLTLETKKAGRDRLAANDVVLLDCPVSGTGAQAGSRDLVVFASGPSDAIDRVESVLDAIAKNIRRVGPFGAGTHMKFLANLLVIVHTTAAAEMLALAERAGIDPAVALETIAAGAGQSRMLEQRGPQMVGSGPDVTATVRTFRKDLGLIDAFARAVGGATPLLDAAAQMYAQAVTQGWGDRDVTVVHDVYRASAGFRRAAESVDESRAGPPSQPA